MGVWNRTGMFATRDESGEMRHIDEKGGSTPIRNGAETFEIDDARWPKLAAYTTRLLAHPAFQKRAAADMKVMKSLPL